MQSAKRASQDRNTDAADFIRRLQSTPGTYFQFTTDANNCLQRAFWASKEQLEHAVAYGDVIVQDCTFNTTSYGLALWLVVAVDSENK